MNSKINKILQMDCLEYLAQIPNKSVDLILTSPPYDNLRNYEKKKNDWNFDFFQMVATELSRVLKIGGVIVWIVGDQTVDKSESGSSFKQALFFKENCKLKLHDTMIYAKKCFSPYDPRNKRYKNQFEYMFVFAKDFVKNYNPIKDVPNKNAFKSFKGRHGRKTNGEIRPQSENKKFFSEFQDRSNIWFYAQETKIFLHPAPFPKNLAKDHILSWSNPNDIVLDCFMGSGTTALACIETGRNFLGCEREEKYVKIANDRIEARNNVLI